LEKGGCGQTFARVGHAVVPASRSLS
jgi:hypothetical protein